MAKLIIPIVANGQNLIGFAIVQILMRAKRHPMEPQRVDGFAIVQILMRAKRSRNEGQRKSALP